MTPRQPEGMDTTNKLVATSRQRELMMGAGSKSEFLIFDLFKSRIFQ